ncbi:MAG: ChrR family anti-sigma-E factor [Rhodovibrio sp.]|nr:ChrR family anti-sigma-E factor [Rhodovibrio sp.]
MAEHLAPDDLLQEYAAGNLSEPLSLLVATHIALKPESRQTVRFYEDVGGALLEASAPESMSNDAFERVMARIEADAPVVPDGGTAAAPADDAERTREALPEGVRIAADVPAPLRDYLASTGSKASWRHRGGSVAELDLLPDFPGYKTRLLRITAGSRIPQHTHDGAEYTLVLEGSFTDATGRYARGDVSVADDEVTHQPVAGQESDCICLAVTDAPLKMTGPFGRILNYFVDM